MKWEDFVREQEEKKDVIRVGMRKVDIQCPKCGEDIFLLTGSVLTSYPPKNSYVCNKCGWGGSV